MVLIQPIQAKRSIDIGGVPSTARDDSVGQGLRQIGGAIQGLADARNDRVDHLAKMQNQNDDFAESQRLAAFKTQFQEQSKRNTAEADWSKIGYTKTTVEDYRKKSQEFLAQTPPALRGKYATLLDTFGVAVGEAATSTELAGRNQWFSDGIATRADEAAARVAANPDDFDSNVAEVDSLIDTTPWADHVKSEAKKEVLNNLKLARAGSLVRTDPARLLGPEAGKPMSGGIEGDNAIEVVTSRIIGAESGGRANAKNPRSSASGVGQFIDSTWLSTIKKHRPDIASGRSDRELLSLKGDPSLGRELTQRLTEDNASQLRASGVAVTPGTLYLAHFAGSAGAKALFAAGDGQSVEGVLGADVVNRNPFLRGMTVADIKAWADRKMTGGRSGGVYLAPETEGLPFDKRLEVFDQAQASLARQQQALRAQQTAERASEKGWFEKGIQLGDVSSPQQILNSNLDDGDQADLLSKLATKQKDSLFASEAITAYQNGSLRIDPYNADGRKAVDAVGSAISKNVPADQQQAAYEELVRQSGVAPQSVVNAVRSGVESQNAADVLAALQTASRLAQVNPNALSRRDGGGEVQKSLDQYNAYVNNIGLSPERAVKRIMDAKDPDKVKARAALMESKQVKDFIKNTATESNVRDIFDAGLFASDPRLGQTPSESAAMVGEYRTILEESLFDTSGDMDAATVMASERFARRYAPSALSLSGEGVITRHPPELVYPTVGGTHDYIKEQAIEALKEVGFDVNEVFFQAYEDTDADIRQGKAPRYELWFKSGDRMERYQFPFLATPPGNPDAGPVYDLSRARANNEEARFRAQQRLDAMGVDDGGRENSLDQFIDGPVPPAVAPTEMDVAPTQAPSPQSSIQGQRSELFQNAKDTGMLNGGGL